MEYALKFKLLPDKMYTRTAKKLAENRLRFMENFIAQMEKEVRGEN